MSRQQRSLLYIDMAYSLAEVRQRGHEQFFEARHSGGYFGKVIGLHPLADRVVSLASSIERKRFSDAQDIIEAKSMALGLPGPLAPFNMLISQRRLLAYATNIIRTESVDAIAATDPLYSGLFGLWLKRKTNCPLIVHLVANYDLNFEATGSLAMPRLFPSRSIERQVIRHVLKRADLVAAGSRTLADYAIAEGAAPERVELFRVTKNMTAAHRLTPEDRVPLTIAERQRLGLREGTRKLLTVARLEPVKMVDHSIRAFAAIAAKHPDALLLLAGQGSERQKLECLARELDVSERVKFLGLVDQDLLSRLAPGALVLSPLTGMALAETSMAGCPAVAYDCDSSVGDLVESGKTGWLIETGDTAGMSRAADRLLSDRRLFARMSKAIRQRAEVLADEERLYAAEHAAFDRMFARFRHSAPAGRREPASP